MRVHSLAAFHPYADEALLCRIEAAMDCSPTRHGLRKNLIQDVAMDVGQPEVTAAVAIG